MNPLLEQKILDRLKDLVPLRCPVCKAKDRVIRDGFYTLSRDDRAGTRPDQARLGDPCVGLECKRCGNVQLHNLETLGLIDDIPLADGAAPRPFDE